MRKRVRNPAWLAQGNREMRQHLSEELGLSLRFHREGVLGEGREKGQGQFHPY